MEFSSTIDEEDHLKVKDAIRGIVLFGIWRGILSLGIEDVSQDAIMQVRELTPEKVV